MGGQGGEWTDRRAGLEADRYDPHCRHLLLTDTLRDNAVIGTTRILTSEGARDAGRFASEEEFDLSGLRRTGRSLLEVGRTCLHPDHRGGGALQRLWQGLAAIVAEEGAEILFGLASFPALDPAPLAQPLSLLHHDHLAPEVLRPRSRWPVAMNLLPREQVDRRKAVLAMPPLIKAYLRLGGVVGDNVFRDEAFGCIDVCMLLDTARLNGRARMHYLGGAA
jgi:putative hemolysin